jgi:hypothetical protein
MLKRFICFIAIIYFGLSLSSCKKNLYFQISGFVFDQSFNRNLDGGKIVLEQISADGSEKSEVILESTINSSGSFELKFKREKSIKYILTITKDNYFTHREEINFDDLDTSIPLILKIDVFAKSWIKFNIENQGTVSSSDVYTLFFNNPKTNCEECCSLKKYFFNGQTDTTFSCLFDGGKNYEFEYIISSPFSQDKFYVTTIPFDTVEVIKVF